MISDYIRHNRIKNECIRKRVGVTPIAEKIVESLALDDLEEWIKWRVVL